jgi:hypothetical protein
MMLLKRVIIFTALSFVPCSWATLPCETAADVQRSLDIAKGLLERAESEETAAKEKVNQIQGVLDTKTDKDPDKAKVKQALNTAKEDLKKAEMAKAFKQSNYDGYKKQMQPSVKANLDKSCTAVPTEKSEEKPAASAERKRWEEEGKFDVQTPDGKVTVSVPKENVGKYEAFAADGHMSPAEIRETGMTLTDSKGNTLAYQGDTNANGTQIGHTFGSGDGAKTYVDPDGIGKSSSGAFHSANDLKGVNTFVDDAALTRATALQATTKISQPAPNGATNYQSPIDNFYTKLNPDGSTTLVARTRGIAATAGGSTNQALTSLGSLLPASKTPTQAGPSTRGFAASQEILDLGQCGTALQCK